MSLDLPSATPGRELPQWLRDIVRRLIREQKFRYVRGTGKHPKLYNSHGRWIPLPTTIFDGPVRHQYLANIKSLGADLEFKKNQKRDAVITTAKHIAEVIDAPWTESEWRQMQASSEVWWRRVLAGPTETTDQDPAKPCETIQHSEWFRGFMERLDNSTPHRLGGVRADARGERGWTLAAARQMLRDGYTLERVIQVTGWGSMWLEDLASRLESAAS